MDAKKQIEKIAAKCQRLLEVLPKLPADMEVCMDPYALAFVLSVSDMDGLHTMRHRLRECLGIWNDKLTMVWSSIGNGLASYESSEWPIEIRLCTPIEKFPPEIMGTTCQFVPRVETKYEYVCNRSVSPESTPVPGLSQI